MSIIEFCNRTFLIGVLILLQACSDSWDMWDKSRSVSETLAIVNDSLALHYSYRCYTSQNNWILEDEESNCYNNIGLQLTNYRKQQTPLWNDTLNYYFDILGQLGDSSVYGGEFKLNGNIKFWKINSKLIDKQITSWFSNK